MGFEIYLLTILALFSVFVRFLVSIHPHSGQHRPPMFGDYEAQRHWLEITINLPIRDWYTNTSENDLLYWGLDYPPLTAYHSWILGKIAQYVNTSWVALRTSRGMESPESKIFMRFSVVITDITTYIPAVFMFLRTFAKHRMIESLAVALLWPGLVLIDHGHFQYNCVSLGLAAYAALFVVLGAHRVLTASFSISASAAASSPTSTAATRTPTLATRCTQPAPVNGVGSVFGGGFFVGVAQCALGSALFTLALCYKQMSLYLALAFFSLLAALALRLAFRSFAAGVLLLAMLGATVVGTFALVWSPFLLDGATFYQVVKRMFPFDRGLYEDKVANVWCALSVVLKLKSLLSSGQLVLVCAGSTLAACVPACAELAFSVVAVSVRTREEQTQRQTHEQHKSGHKAATSLEEVEEDARGTPEAPADRLAAKFLLCATSTALSFFLFSYQVHEKSILLAALPMSLLFRWFPIDSIWFLLVSTLSMWQLFIKDSLVIAAIACVLVFLCSLAFSLDTASLKLSKAIQFLYASGLALQICACALCSLAHPPERYPDLFTWALAAISCALLVMVHLRCLCIQWRTQLASEPAEYKNHYLKEKQL